MSEIVRPIDTLLLPRQHAGGVDEGDALEQGGAARRADEVIQERGPELRQRRERQVRGDGERVPLDEASSGRGGVVRDDGAGRRTAAAVAAAVAMMIAIVVVVPLLVVLFVPPPPPPPPAEESGGGGCGRGRGGIDRPVPAVEQGQR